VHATLEDLHHHALEIMAARALAEGDAATAFRLADRRCRILPPPEPHDYVLRGEALARMGAQAAARRDIVRALEAAPDDRAANRRMLAWGDSRERSRAARTLLGVERDFAVIGRAIEILREEGPRPFARLEVLDGVVAGWAAWEEPAPLEVVLHEGATSTTAHFAADASHPLRLGLNAVSFTLARPRTRGPLGVTLSIEGKVFHSLAVPGRDGVGRGRDARARPPSSAGGSATVIVPVYADFAATRACLEGLLREVRGSHHRAVIVNDATPDARIAHYLGGLAGEPRIELLTNATNLGFVGSVNRALDRVVEGDVVLLNADTIVPSRFIDRLAAAARSAPEIGTVTPLSNNGEFTSFPFPNTGNPLPAAGEMARLDRLAARLGAGRVVDIPTGIGFCLYVTRACLDAVGRLSQNVHRGYLEDADFCLRARERGFRNVCAASVYVGHAGSKSFGSEKRSLVVRNLVAFERKYPEHRAECAAFVAADPLRGVRQAIERLAPSLTRAHSALLTGMGAVSAIARERARRLAARAHKALIFEIRSHGGGPRLAITDPAGGLPQSIEFDLALPSERAALETYIRRLRLSRCEILDPARVPAAIVDVLRKAGLAYDVFAADGGLAGFRAASLRCAAVPAQMREAGESVLLREGCPPQTVESAALAIAAGAERILVPCAQARAFVTRLLPTAVICDAEPSAEAPVTRLRGSLAPIRRLGIIPLCSSIEDESLITAIVLGGGHRRPQLDLTVVGATLDDMALMRMPNVFVTGPVDAAELPDVIGGYRLQALVVVSARPLFGHPVQNAARTLGLPLAYFDWSMGGVKACAGDLALNPRLRIDDLLGALIQWLQLS
jgi:GT2 family glycosyltransferase